MTLTWSAVGAALLWTSIAALATWLILTPVRRRSLAGLLTSLVLTGAAASMGALWGAMYALMTPAWGWQTAVALTGFSAVVTALAAVGVGRRLGKDNAALRAAVADLGAGRTPTSAGRKLTAEMDRVRRELQTTAEALAATRERERALETSRRELVSWVSHDLRTPLAGLRAMAEALEDGVVDNPEFYYKQIGSSVERLNQMVEDLFDLSRIQAGAMPHEIDRIALSDLVSDTVAALEPLATAQGVHLSGSVDGTAAVSGSGRELNRALTNLVANAIRHTRTDGHVDVRVAVSPVPGDATDISIAEVLVKDECGGIPAEHLARVFEVGFRGEAARTPHSAADYTGAGLGLAITRGIVEAHDGTVEVENVDDGCRFRVRLPVAT